MFEVTICDLKFCDPWMGSCGLRRRFRGRGLESITCLTKWSDRRIKRPSAAKAHIWMSLNGTAGSRALPNPKVAGFFVRFEFGQGPFAICVTVGSGGTGKREEGCRRCGVLCSDCPAFRDRDDNIDQTRNVGGVEADPWVEEERRGHILRRMPGGPKISCSALQEMRSPTLLRYEGSAFVR